MKTKSIAHIKQLLQENELTAKDIHLLRNDERKGIQQLLRTYDRQQEKLALERNTFYQMKAFDNSYKNTEQTILAGIDEAGRGPLAGPVVSAAVILPNEFECIGLIDSKLLTAQKREEYYHYIKENAVDYHISVIDSEEIDRLNILESTRQSMQQAVLQLNTVPDVTLVDAVDLQLNITKGVSITKGDQKSIAIAAASILAKVARDTIMTKMDELYPEYDFKHNKGYGSQKHLMALQKYGPTPIHRLSFSPVQQAMQTYTQHR